MLQAYESKKLFMAAFPCNQFNMQEPGENHEILNGLKYVRPGNNFTPHQNLHIYGKLEVNGENVHPLYRFLKVTLQNVDILSTFFVKNKHFSERIST